MSAKYVALIVAAVVLSACETTSVTEEAAAPKKRIVVRGEVVPDEPAKSKKATVRKASAVRTARASAPVVPAGEMAPVIDATPGASSGGTDAGTGAGTGAGHAGSTGADTGTTAPGADTSALADASATVPSTDVTATPLQPIEPTTVTAEPVSAPATPSRSPFAIDFREMMNATVAGFPLWLMVVVAIVLAGALVFGTGGRRAAPREERDYEPRPYPEREKRYDEASYDDEDERRAEPQPA
jgi:hypothetical protein